MQVLSFAARDAAKFDGVERAAVVAGKALCTTHIPLLIFPFRFAVLHFDDTEKTVSGTTSTGDTVVFHPEKVELEVALEGGAHDIVFEPRMAAPFVQLRYRSFLPD